MKTTTRRRALSLLTASSALALVPAPTLLAATEDPFEGGIGGTGIVGLMTGQGSIFINGLRVEVPDSARLTLNGIAVTESDLLPGVAMTVVAEARGDRFVAARVDAEHPLIGLVEEIGGVTTINGAAIVMDPGARTAPMVGQRMAASGVWRADGALQTSLIQPVAGQTDRVAGTVTAAGRIGQTEIEARGLIPGEYAAITGRYGDGTFRAQQVQNGRFQAGTALDQLSVEGYLEPVAAAPGFRIAGLGHSFARSLDLSPYAARRNVFFGRYAGLFVARRAVALPERQAARLRLLTPGDDASVAVGLGRARRIRDR
ncbi:MAG: hypothetical protein AAF601_08335 [Pseudomonadota bacterium]